jgi:hypothetical protein
VHGNCPCAELVLPDLSRVARRAVKPAAGVRRDIQTQKRRLSREITAKRPKDDDFAWVSGWFLLRSG